MAAELERRALAAACGLAATYEVPAGEAAVIASGSNVLVHLRPAPVVARVMTGTVALHGDPQRWLEREVAVVAFLEPSGLAVPPSGPIPAGPHHRDGLWMTCTGWVPQAAPPPERGSGVDLATARAFGRELRQLHDALQPFTGELGGPAEVRGDIERLLRGVKRAGDGERIACLAARLDELGPSVFDADLPLQALHGDASLRNLLDAGGRPLWNDFEDTFRGPVHWDLASAVGSLRIHGADAATITAMLTAYGWDDEPALAPFLAAQDVYDEIWQRFDRLRRR